MRTIRIGTRGSALALKQTSMVREALLSLDPAVEIEVVIVKTTGDILADVPLDVIGGKGVFVKEIERALLDNEIDCAVHSLKDMQALLPESLIISAYLKREDPRDMLFSKAGHTIETLPAGSRLGTSSMRRRCQMKLLRPDIEILDIRGNVPTRLAKVGDTLDAVVLAAAGVRRLGLAEGLMIDTMDLVPSPGQGIIAVETREQDAWLNDLLAGLDHAPTRICAETERAFLAALGQDCNLPAGALATYTDNVVSITGVLGSPDETRLERLGMEGNDASIGRTLALALKNIVRPEALS